MTSVSKQRVVKSKSFLEYFFILVRCGFRKKETIGLLQQIFRCLLLLHLRRATGFDYWNSIFIWRITMIWSHPNGHKLFLYTFSLLLWHKLQNNWHAVASSGWGFNKRTNWKTYGARGARRFDAKNRTKETSKWFAKKNIALNDFPLWIFVVGSQKTIMEKQLQFIFSRKLHVQNG